ncbi:hypothetical protein AOCH_002805 [Aspergillus ochraceoroseus]|nr:hypothetical protein AOCH_002805 [Aspergillus ochraceoroseus]
MNWSSQAYGPDGPWQAVTISVGSNNQSVDLYPGANWASTIMMDSLCTNKTLSTTCYAASAGTYNNSESTSAISLNTTSWQTFYWGVQGGSIEGVIADQVNIGPVVPNVSFTGIYQTYQTYPNGQDYPVSVGNLALGAPKLKDEVSNLTLNMIASSLYSSGDIPSYSYGMHIGSANAAIPGSLVLGGYDQSRILGDVSAQSVSLNEYSSGNLQISLKDIGLGVATGGSPFSFTSKNGLFLQSSGAVVPKTVAIDPTKPYLYLPEATCNAITSSFPVFFDEGLGLYIWDTSNGDYDRITSSATYLSFVFNQNGINNQNITIKVPLSLLALTLQAPLVNQNATYFPCFHSTDTPVLGRPFLQAAFVGVNWFEGDNTGTWFLAQAPGPGAASANITTINIDDSTLSGSSRSWEHSWAGFWHPLAESSSSNSTTGNSTGPGADSSGLSTGAKAGIGVGVSVAGLILIALVVWIVMLRRRRKNAPQDSPVEERTSVIKRVVELPGRDKDGPAKELYTQGNNVHPREIMGSQEPPRYELD